MRTNVGGRKLLTTNPAEILIFVLYNKFSLTLEGNFNIRYACLFCVLLVNADAVLKGTNVNSIYECHSGNDDMGLDHISFREVSSRGITSMDMMAITYCEENGIPGSLHRLIFVST